MNQRHAEEEAKYIAELEAEREIIKTGVGLGEKIKELEDASVHFKKKIPRATRNRSAYVVSSVFYGQQAEVMKAIATGDKAAKEKRLKEIELEIVRANQRRAIHLGKA